MDQFIWAMAGNMAGMSRADPVEHALIRLELRRFASRCDQQESALQRADSLREVARLAAIPVPARLSGEYDARDFQRRVAQAAEERARQLILDQIDIFARGEGEFRQKIRGKMREDWSNLTGPLAHLRNWANSKLLVAEQNQ
jgi:hypothetical protein